MYLVATAAQQVGSCAACDEVEFELCVVMASICTGRAGVTPRHTVEVSGEFEPLQHDDKK
jgi:hypothetical protein